MMSITRLARDDRGASIVELALVAPILASLLIGMVDLSRAYSHKLLLEQAAQRSIEKVQQYQASSSTADLLKAETVAAAKDAGFASTTVADVTVDFWLECNGTRAADYDTVCADGQTYGRWVSIDLQGTFSPMFRSRRWPGANTDGTFTLHGRAGMRTQ
jgi:Flp pilus assembly protein TadG